MKVSRKSLTTDYRCKLLRQPDSAYYGSESPRAVFTRTRFSLVRSSIPGCRRKSLVCYYYYYHYYYYYYYYYYHCFYPQPTPTTSATPSEFLAFSVGCSPFTLRLTCRVAFLKSLVGKSGVGTPQMYVENRGKVTCRLGVCPLLRP